MAKPLCPLLRKPCIENKCKFWTHIQGQNPQSGEVFDKFDCTFALFPILLLENSQQQRQTGAAVESLRNEVAAGAGSFMYAAIGKKLEDRALLRKEDDENPG